MHLIDRILAGIHHLVERGDRTVNVLAVDRCREGFVQRVDVADLDLVCRVLVILDLLADRVVAGFHVAHQQGDGMLDLAALIRQQPEEVGGLGKEALVEANQQGFLFVHGVLPVRAGKVLSSR